MTWLYNENPLEVSPQGSGWVASLAGLEDGPRAHGRTEIEAATELLAFLYETQWQPRSFAAGGQG